MANAYSIADNPWFQNIETQFTELFDLLSKLTTTEDYHILIAICQHLENALHKLHVSIQSLGALLATAAENQEMKMSLKDVANIGWLIQLLADLLAACYTLESNSTAKVIKRDCA